VENFVRKFFVIEIFGKKPHEIVDTTSVGDTKTKNLVGYKFITQFVGTTSTGDLVNFVFRKSILQFR